MSLARFNSDMRTHSTDCTYAQRSWSEKRQQKKIHDTRSYCSRVMYKVLWQKITKIEENVSLAYSDGLSYPSKIDISLLVSSRRTGPARLPSPSKASARDLYSVLNRQSLRKSSGNSLLRANDMYLPRTGRNLKALELY